MLQKGYIFLAIIVVHVKASCEDVEWTGGRFEFPSEEIETKYRADGEYIPKNIIAVRAQIFRDDIFVALPRYKPGIPVTLARVCMKCQSCEAVLTPFPNWTAQEIGNCDSLQSVVDIFIDSHAILWALDIGVVDILDSPLRKSTPKVVAFNLLTGKKVKTLDLSGLVVQASRLQYVIAEYGFDGKPFVYITDAATRSILVFDVTGGSGYRVVLPKAALGCKRDVLYAALVHKTDGVNFLIITYLSGSRLFAIRTDYLRAGSAAGHIQDLGEKDGTIVIVGTDGGSALFYRYEGKPQIYRWDTNEGLFSRGLMVYTSPKCYLGTHVIPDVKRMRMRVLESNFPDYIEGTVGCGAAQRVALMVSEVPK